VHTEPIITRVCPVAVGGQGVVMLCHLHLDESEALRLAAEGWIVHGLPGDRHLICVSKSAHPPASPPGSRLYPFEVRERRRTWHRLRREYALLQRANGVGLPRPYAIIEPDPSRAWEGEFFEEYIEGLTVTDALARGLAPSPEELIEFAWALFETFGGPTGTVGLPESELAHRDVTPGQVIIPLSGGRLAWDRPVLLDLGVGYHPDEPLRNDEGHPYPTTEGLPRSTGWFPPERARPTYDEELDRVARLLLDGAGDLWGWAMVVGFAATGENLWGVRESAPGEHLVTDSWRRVMAGEEVAPQRIGAVADPALAAALLTALHPEPLRRDRAAIAALLPGTLRHRALEVTLALDVLRSELTETQAALDDAATARDAAAEALATAAGERDAARDALAAAAGERDAARDALARAAREQQEAETQLAKERRSSRDLTRQVFDLTAAQDALRVEHQQRLAAPRPIDRAAPVIEVPTSFSGGWMHPFAMQRNHRPRHAHDGVWRIEVEQIGSVRFEVRGGCLVQWRSDAHRGVAADLVQNVDLLFFDANARVSRAEFEAALRDPSQEQPKALAAFLDTPAD
jgi:hypothetical protein